MDETLSALTDLIRAGKIRYAGSSTFPPSQIVEAQWVAQRRGRERFVCEQPPYSIMVRGVEAEVLPVCNRAQRLPQRFDLSLPGNQAKLEAAEQLAVLAEETGLSLIHLALAFVIRHPAVTAAIIGPRTMEHLEGQQGAADVTLDTEVLDRIDDIVPPGTDLNQSDRGYDPPALTTPSLRRRPA